jgi:DNA-binding PadR family transcriptional regulator
MRRRQVPTADDPTSFLPLPSAPLHILVALREGERHGYAVMQDVERLSDGAVKMGPGTLYGAIKRLLVDGLIEESAERPVPELDDQRRRYYRLTGLGERVCSAELARLANLIQRAGGASRRPSLLGEA